MIKQFTRQQLVGFFLLLCGIYAVSGLIQSSVLMGWDISWGLHEAKRLYAGGRYFHDFYEMTPPIFLYLYIPIIILVKTGLNLSVALAVYLFLLSAGSLAICFSLVKKIFSENDRAISLIFLLAIALTLLVFPLPQDFGQRENLLLIFIMPYILLISLRLINQPIDHYFAAMIGLLGGIAFAIKPYFFITYILLELYYIGSKRKILAWMRIETFMMGGLLITYFLTTYFFYPDYFKIILPLAARTYYQGVGESWRLLIIQPVFLYVVFIATCCLLLQKINPYRALSNCLLLGSLGFSSCYLLQQTLWYYHALPAYALANILAVLLYSLFIKYSHLFNNKFSMKNKLLPIGCVILGCVFYSINTLGIASALVFYRAEFFAFFAVLFLLLYYLAQPKKNIYYAMGVVALLLALGFYLSSLIRLDLYWYNYSFLSTVILLIILFFLVVPGGLINKYHSLAYVLLGTLFFAYPIYNGVARYEYGKGYASIMENLQVYLKKYAKQEKVYFFSTALSHEFPAVDYAEAIPVSRYGTLLWLPAYLRADVATQAKLAADNQFFLATVIGELAAKQPEYVFIDVTKDKLYLPNINYSYLADFSRHPEFVKVWKNYHYITTVKNNPFYEFAVYQRSSNEK